MNHFDELENLMEFKFQEEFSKLVRGSRLPNHSLVKQKINRGGKIFFVAWVKLQKECPDEVIVLLSLNKRV